jgi:hypothetical protein
MRHLPRRPMCHVHGLSQHRSRLVFLQRLIVRRHWRYDKLLRHRRRRRRTGLLSTRYFVQVRWRLCAAAEWRIQVRRKLPATGRIMSVIGPAVAEPFWIPVQSVDDMKMRRHAVCMTPVKEGGYLVHPL